MFYLIAIPTLLIVQLIYVSGTDVPFYYKEIIYDWNYTINKNVRFDNVMTWISLCTEKGYMLEIPYQKEANITIQTDLFSHQQQASIHEYLNTVLLTMTAILIFYIMYTATNAILYKHEKKKLNIIVLVSIIVLAISIYTYNTELLTSILYKTSFTYTDNIYINNTKENNAKWLYLVNIISITYYIRGMKTQLKQSIVRYNIYIMILILNILNENTIIGIEYLYIIIYMEILIVIIHSLSNMGK